MTVGADDEARGRLRLADRAVPLPRCLQPGAVIIGGGFGPLVRRVDLEDFVEVGQGLGRVVGHACPPHPGDLAGRVVLAGLPQPLAGGLALAGLGGGDPRVEAGHLHRLERGGARVVDGQGFFEVADRLDWIVAQARAPNPGQFVAGIVLCRQGQQQARSGTVAGLRRGDRLPQDVVAAPFGHVPLPRHPPVGVVLACSDSCHGAQDGTLLLPDFSRRLMCGFHPYPARAGPKDRFCPTMGNNDGPANIVDNSGNRQRKARFVIRTNLKAGERQNESRFQSF